MRNTKYVKIADKHKAPENKIRNIDLILNNKDEYYSNYVNFRIPLYDIDKGTSIKTKTTVGSEYNFFTI